MGESAGGTVQGPPISLGEGVTLSTTQVPTEDAGQTSANASATQLPEGEDKIFAPSIGMTFGVSPGLVDQDYGSIFGAVTDEAKAKQRRDEAEAERLRVINDLAASDDEEEEEEDDTGGAPQA